MLSRTLQRDPSSEGPQVPNPNTLLVQNPHKAKHVQLPTEVARRARRIWEEGNADAGAAARLALHWLFLTGFLSQSSPQDLWSFLIQSSQSTPGDQTSGRDCTRAAKDNELPARHTWRPRKEGSSWLTYGYAPS